MIVVKTRIKSIPRGCSKCSFYLRRTQTIYDRPACMAMPAYGQDGKPINPSHAVLIMSTKGRPNWCPIIEIREGNRGS